MVPNHALRRSINDHIRDRLPATTRSTGLGSGNQTAGLARLHHGGEAARLPLRTRRYGTVPAQEPQRRKRRRAMHHRRQLRAPGQDHQKCINFSELIRFRRSFPMKMVLIRVRFPDCTPFLFDLNDDDSSNVLINQKIDMQSPCYALESAILEDRSGRRPWQPCRTDDRSEAVEVVVPNRSCCTPAIPSVGDGTTLVSGLTAATPPKCVR